MIVSLNYYAVVWSAAQMPIGITSKYRFLIPSLYIDSEFRKNRTNFFEKF